MLLSYFQVSEMFSNVVSVHTRENYVFSAEQMYWPGGGNDNKLRKSAELRQICDLSAAS